MERTKDDWRKYYLDKISDSDCNKQLCEEFLKIKQDSFNSVLGYKDFLNSFYRIYSKTFQNSEINQISPKMILNELSNINISDKKKRESLNQLLLFLYFLEWKQVDLHERLKGISAIKCFYSGALDHNFKMKVFRNENGEMQKIVVVKNNSYFVNVDDSEMLSVIKDFVKKYCGANPTTERVFLMNLADSIKGIHSVYELHFKHMVDQFKYFDNYCKNHSEISIEKIRSVILKFYKFLVADCNIDIFKGTGLNLVNAQQTKFISALLDDYVLVNQNTIESVPEFDKWMFVPQKTSNRLSKYILIDFSQIEVTTYKNWVKWYVWNFYKPNGIQPLIDFCNIISSLKSGQTLSIYTTPNKDTSISMNELFAYRMLIENKYPHAPTHSNILAITKNFLLSLQKMDMATFDYSVNYCLAVSEARGKVKNAKAIPDSELKLLSKLLKEKAEQSTINKLYYLIFYILLETEFRLTQVVNLTIDCVKETNKPNEYVIVSATKTSHDNVVEQPITIYVKKHIDEIIKTTQEYRDNCQDLNLKRFLFIKQRSNLAVDAYGIISPTMFSKYLSDCCRELGIHEYNASNLRDTHMTKAEEFVIRNQLSDMQQNVLSGHSSPTIDNKYYIDANIKEMLEAVHGIIIGNVSINGQVIDSKTDELKPENEVSNGCGYCNCKSCSDFSMLDCMMCKDFVTTVEKLPYFEEQIKILDERIKNAVIPHDKEDLINIKRLHLGFINEILKIKERCK